MVVPFLYLLFFMLPSSSCAQQMVYAAGKAPVHIIDNNFLALLSLKFVQQICSQETISPLARNIQNASFKYIDYQFVHFLKRARAEDFKHQIWYRRALLGARQVDRQEAVKKFIAEFDAEEKEAAQKNAEMSHLIATHNEQHPYLARWIFSKLNWKFAKLRCKRLICTTKFIVLAAILAVTYLVSRKIPQNSSLYPVESKFEWLVTWISPYLINFIINTAISRYTTLYDPLQAEQHPYKTFTQRAGISLGTALVQYFAYIQISSHFHPYILPTQQEYVRDFTQNVLFSNMLSLL